VGRLLNESLNLGNDRASTDLEVAFVKDMKETHSRCIKVLKHSRCKSS
jgi:hypothetical protein